jgi:hypothetical protein
MNIELFEKALALTRDAGFLLTKIQQQVIDTFLKSDNKAVHVKLKANAGHLTVQTLIAALFALTQTQGDILYLGRTANESRQWLEEMNGHLEDFEESEEFGYTLLSKDKREFTHIKNKFGAEVRVTTASLGSLNNLRGMGSKLALIMTTASEDVQYDFAPYAPLLAAGARLFMFTIV